MRGNSRGIMALAFSPDGSTIATGGSDYAVKLWNVSAAHSMGTLPTPKATVMSLAFSPDGNALAVGQWGVTLWAGPDAKTCLAILDLLSTTDCQAAVRWTTTQRRIRVLRQFRLSLAGSIF
jgi:WD40 repeat protein